MSMPSVPAPMPLVGGGTWRADRPRLDVRLPGLEHHAPQRIVLTRGVAPDGVRVNTPAQIAALEALYLYVEAGADIAASLLADDLVDRLEIYRAADRHRGRPGCGVRFQARRTR